MEPCKNLPRGKVGRLTWPGVTTIRLLEYSNAPTATGSEAAGFVKGYTVGRRVSRAELALGESSSVEEVETGIVGINPAVTLETEKLLAVGSE